VQANSGKHRNARSQFGAVNNDGILTPQGCSELGIRRFSSTTAGWTPFRELGANDSNNVMNQTFVASQRRHVRFAMGVTLLYLLIVHPSPVAGTLPDLVVNPYRLQSSVEVQRRYIADGDCSVVEGCTPAAGLRKLLLFDVGIANVGKEDVVIGMPGNNPYPFVYSPCHAHYHLNNFCIYRLLTLDYAKIVKARKQGFCLRDDKTYKKTAGPGSGYTCAYQGISAGWQDVYDKSLDCQWLDITGVPPGDYYLEITVNPFRVFTESNYSNNQVLIRITIPRLGSP
jgi:hypothetical protein